MNRPEDELPFSSRDKLCPKIELLISTGIVLHPLLKNFISPSEIKRAAEAITEFVDSLARGFPIEIHWDLSLFRGLVSLTFPPPEKNGATSFIAKSKASAADSEGIIGPFMSKDSHEEKLEAATNIIDVTLACLDAQLNVTLQRIRSGSDDVFDHVFISLLAGKEPILGALNDWYGRMENGRQLQEFGQLSNAMLKVNEPYLLRTERGMQFGIQLIRGFVADVISGCDTCIRICNKPLNKQADLEAFFEISNPRQFGRSVVQSAVEIPPQEPDIYTSGHPGPLDHRQLPESMVFFVQQIFYHLSHRDLWSELE